MQKKIRRTSRRHSGPRVTVLLSGGIDSTACLSYYLREGFHVGALFIDHGQAGAKREARAAKSICRHFRVPLKIVRLIGSTDKGPGLIAGRNAFLLLTAALEFKARAGVIALGIHSGTRYRDCSPYFVQRMQAVLDIYTGGAVQIGAPFLNWRKADIWAFATRKDVPLSLTYSCERGLEQPCGSCDSCLDLEALRASVPSRKYVHIVAGLWQRSNPQWRSRRKAGRGCWKRAHIDRFSPPVP